MLADPLVIDATFVLAADIPAISREPSKSIYRLTVGAVKYTVTIQHATANGRRRTNVRLDANNIVADPYVPAQNVEDTTSVYLVIDRSERLVTDANVLVYVKELIGVLASSTFANITTTRLAQLIAGES